MVDEPTESVAAFVRSEGAVVVVPVLGKAPNLFVAPFLGRREHPALTAGGHDLVLAEVPAREVAPRADRPPINRRPVDLCAVLEDGQTVPLRPRHDRGYVAGPAADVDGNHGPGTRRPRGSRGRDPR
jgi:hypothetical protein